MKDEKKTITRVAKCDRCGTEIQPPGLVANGDACSCHGTYRVVIIERTEKPADAGDEV